MEQRSKDVVSKFARGKLRIEEYVEGMGQSATHAATRDVQIMSSREECALGMGQKLNAAAKKGECVKDMGHIASHRTNLQHFSSM